MNSKDQLYDEVFKIVLVGDSGVGKTNLLAYDPKEVQSDEFTDRYKPTVGVEFSSKIVVADDGKRIKAQIWDTAGQERYRAITSSHYRRSAGAMLVYDVTSPESLQRASEVWLEELLKSSEDETIMKQCISLIGNKIDLEAKISTDEHEKAVKDMGLSLNARTSAKTGDNVERAFEDLIKHVYLLQKNKVGRRSSSLMQKKKHHSSLEHHAADERQIPPNAPNDDENLPLILVVKNIEYRHEISALVTIGTGRLLVLCVTKLAIGF